uniref:C-type lectin domain family 1 member A n=1 Tax=Loxodonta africana TaxID=9785 RepID=G3TS66_LOXAF
SSVWRPLTLTVLTLCLVLLIGLAALGILCVCTQKYLLSTQNRKLAATLQRMAENLCRELYNKTGDKLLYTFEHRCSPCPGKWKWRGDKCYQFYKESRSWQGCEYFCIAENSTMLKINTQEVLDKLVKTTTGIRSYWTGLSRNSSGKDWLWMDGTHYSSELFDIVIDFTSIRSRDCVTILNGKAFSKDCRELRRCACERTAAAVRPEWLY